MRLLILIPLLLVVIPAGAAIEAYEFKSPQMEADYQRLTQELRCLVCQNQNLAGSNADLAKDLRHQIYVMLSRGDTADQVVDYMVARYGDFVLYRPRFDVTTYLLWLGPFVLLVIVLIVLVRRLRCSRENHSASGEAMEEARKLLQQDGSV